MTVGVNTGFIKDQNNISTQIDLIIYNPALPLYFQENDFIIVQPKSVVLGIIEVKSNPDRNKIAEVIFKASKVGEIIEENLIFNGLFIFGEANNNQNHTSKLLKNLKIANLKSHYWIRYTKKKWRKQYYFH